MLISKQLTKFLRSYRKNSKLRTDSFAAGILTTSRKRTFLKNIWLFIRLAGLVVIFSANLMKTVKKKYFTVKIRMQKNACISANTNTNSMRIRKGENISFLFFSQMAAGRYQQRMRASGNALQRYYSSRVTEGVTMVLISAHSVCHCYNILRIVYGKLAKRQTKKDHVACMQACTLLWERKIAKLKGALHTFFSARFFSLVKSYPSPF